MNRLQFNKNYKLTDRISLSVNDFDYDISKTKIDNNQNHSLDIKSKVQLIICDENEIIDLDNIYIRLNTRLTGNIYNRFDTSASINKSITQKLTNIHTSSISDIELSIINKKMNDIEINLLNIIYNSNIDEQMIDYKLKINSNFGVDLFTHY